LIPKTIHYCWFGDQHPNDVIKRCRDSWRRYLPDYSIREWNESNSPLDSTYCQSAMERKLWSKVSNYVRLWALHQEGGIYLDTDVEIVKPLDSLLHHKCFLGFQRKDEAPGWVNNAVLGSQTDQRFLARCMDLTLKIHEEQGEFLLSPRITTLILKEMGLATYGQQTIGEVTLFPTETFYPYSWLEAYHPACIKDETMAIHHWVHSWAGT
jgi:Glycosyltransferase sugar-binding region containing DXD motif